jgi:hypothetical protein
MVLRSPKLGTGSNMGQFSVEICALPGSILNGNQKIHYKPGKTKMNLFRALLVLILVVLSAYTAIVIANHGINLLAVFFSDIAAMAWPGQFNLDFLGFLILSGIWTAWRHQFSPAGLGLGVLAFFGGMMFLTIYLLIVSLRTKGDVGALLLGEARAGQR